jgi:hypothetical protein
MYLLLLVFGALLSVAGIILAGSGISIHERAFDATIVTPGIVAVIGGFVLVGLGLALRVLHRIEDALATQPMPRGSRLGEPVARELSAEPAFIGFPTKPASRVAATSPVDPLSKASADEKHPGDLPGKPPELFPASIRAEIPWTGGEAEHSPAPEAPLSKPLSALRADEAMGEPNDFRGARRINGTASARITPRFDMNARSPLLSERPKGPAFDSARTKTASPLRATQTASAQSASAPAFEPVSLQPPSAPAAAAPAVDFEETSASLHELPPTMTRAKAAEAVTVLKSGLVDGMAYTLYSDGSIAAELPQGMLRFGSITELRHHIEQSA